MKDPGEALAAARTAAARAAAAGSGSAAGSGAAASSGSAAGSGEEVAPWSLEDPVTSSRRLAEWAIIEPEHAEVYSTRRFGRPITAIKRLLIRLLAQYIGQISAQQSRFNAQIAAHVMRLEERVRVLERTGSVGGDAPAREAGVDAPAPEAGASPRR